MHIEHPKSGDLIIAASLIMDSDSGILARFVGNYVNLYHLMLDRQSLFMPSNMVVYKVASRPVGVLLGYTNKTCYPFRTALTMFTYDPVKFIINLPAAIATGHQTALKDDEYYISNMCISKSVRSTVAGGRIGLAMLQHIEKTCGMKRILYDTLESNDHIINGCGAYGYRQSHIWDCFGKTYARMVKEL